MNRNNLFLGALPKIKLLTKRLSLLLLPVLVAIGITAVSGDCYTIGNQTICE